MINNLLNELSNDEKLKTIGNIKMQASSLINTCVDLSRNRADCSRRLVASLADLRKIRKLIWKQNEKLLL